MHNSKRKHFVKVQFLNSAHCQMSFHLRRAAIIAVTLQTPPIPKEKKERSNFPAAYIYVLIHHTPFGRRFIDVIPPNRNRLFVVTRFQSDSLFVSTHPYTTADLRSSGSTSPVPSAGTAQSNDLPSNLRFTSTSRHIQWRSVTHFYTCQVHTQFPYLTI